MHAHEQRGATRYPAGNRVRVELSRAGDPGTPTTYHCTPADISLRGVRLDLDAPLESGAQVTLRVHLDGPGTSFAHGGRVAWCRAVPGADPARYNAGIEFTTAAGPASKEWRMAFLGMFG